MGLERARGVALTVLVLVTGVAVLGVNPPATAASRTAPSVSLRLSPDGGVRVSGRTASASPRVRFYRATPSGWSLVKRIRAHHHRYATLLPLEAGATATFKVKADRRSRSFVARSPAPTATTTAAKPAPKPQYDACGARPLKADGTAWSCSFVDDFDGTSLDRTKWIPNTAFITWSGDTHACYRDDPANVNVADGVLNLNLVKLDAPAPCAVAASPTQYMAGSVSTYHLFSQQYGRFEARIRTTATSAPGLHEAFWLWPDDRYSTINWPDSGEIDGAESFSAYPTTVGSYLHYSADHTGLLYGTNAANCAAARGVWNTFTVDWGPSRIETFMNGRSCLVNTSGDPAFQKRYIINLTEAIGGATWNQLSDATPVPASMQVDYVHVWK